MKTPEIIEEVRRTLQDNIDEKTVRTGRNFFKEEVRFYGVKVSLLTKLSKLFYEKVKGETKENIFSYCEILFQSGYNEEAWIACNWAYYVEERYLPEDINTFDRWIDLYVSNWATCDTLCNHAVGTFVEMYPEYVENLKEWAHSPNRWKRRAAAVTLIIPARKGLFLKDIFEIADILLLDTDDLVQKGYGWMLKATSEAYQKEVFQYVLSKKAVMPRTALRYAIEKMPQEMRTEAMRKD